MSREPDVWWQKRADDKDGGPYCIAIALLELADAVNDVASAIHRLGNADAVTPMGGMEALGAVLKEAIDNLANNLEPRP